MRPIDDFIIDGIRPTAVQFPSSLEELTECVRTAHEKSLAVVPLGGGTRRSLGARLHRYDWAVCLSNLEGVTDHFPEDLTVTVWAGTTIATLQSALQRERQFVPLETPRPDRSTVGGVVAVGFSGPSACFYGPIRDQVLGVTVVQPTGTPTAFGGRVVKNVAGYDVTRLYIGSLGTLGIIAQVTLKVRPLPEARASVALRAESLALVENCLAQLVSSPLSPAFVQLLNRSARTDLERYCGFSFEDGKFSLVIGFDGFEEEVKWSLDRLIAISKLSGAQVTATFEGDRDQLIRSGLNRLLDPERPVALRICVPSSQVPALIEDLQTWIGSETIICASALTGVVKAGCEAQDEIRDKLPAIRAVANKRGGFLIAEGIPPDWKATFDVWEGRGKDWHLMKAVKQALDPGDIFAPGRMGW